MHALRGKEFLEYDNPFDVGMTGLLGFSSGYRAIEKCDTLVMLGTDFPYQQFFPTERPSSSSTSAASRSGAVPASISGWSAASPTPSRR